MALETMEQLKLKLKYCSGLSSSLNRKKDCKERLISLV
jgi:hypothetical protein